MISLNNISILPVKQNTKKQENKSAGINTNPIHQRLSFKAFVAPEYRDLVNNKRILKNSSGATLSEFEAKGAEEGYKELMKSLEKAVGEEKFQKLIAGEQLESPLPKLQRGQLPGDWITAGEKIYGVNTNKLVTNMKGEGGFLGALIDIMQSQGANTIHFLPVLESGGCIYAPKSLSKVSDRVFSENFAKLYPEINTPEKQLKFLVETSHALGKKTFMDILLNVGKNSEYIYTRPDYFKWVSLGEEGMKKAKEGLKTGKAGEHVDQLIISEEMSLEGVKNAIFEFVKNNDNIHPQSKEIPADSNEFWALPATEREKFLFGGGNSALAGQRREAVSEFVEDKGYLNPSVTFKDDCFDIVFHRFYKKDSGEVRAVFARVDKDGKHLDKMGEDTSDDNLAFGFPGFNDITRINYANPKAYNAFLEELKETVEKLGFDGVRIDMAHAEFPENVPDPVKGISDAVRQIKGKEHAGVLPEIIETDLTEGKNEQDRIKRGELYESRGFHVILGDSHYRLLDPKYIRSLVTEKACNTQRFFTVTTHDMHSPSHIQGIFSATDRQEERKRLLSKEAIDAKNFIMQTLGIPGYTMAETAPMNPVLPGKDNKPNADLTSFSWAHIFKTNPVDGTNMLFPYGNGKTRQRELKDAGTFYQEKIKKEGLKFSLMKNSETDTPDEKILTYSYSKEGVPKYIFAVNCDTSRARDVIIPLGDAELEQFKGKYELKAIYTNKNDLTPILNNGSPVAIELKNTDSVNLGSFKKGEGRIYELIAKS